MIELNANKSFGYENQLNDIIEEYNNLLYFTLDFYEYKVNSRDYEIKDLKELIYAQELRIQDYAQTKSFFYYLKMCIKALIKKFIPKFMINKLKNILALFRRKK